MQTVNAQSSLVVASIKKEIHAFEDKEPMELKVLQTLSLLKSVPEMISAKLMPGQIQQQQKDPLLISNVVLITHLISLKISPPLPKLVLTETIVLLMEIASHQK